MVVVDDVGWDAAGWIKLAWDATADPRKMGICGQEPQRRVDDVDDDDDTKG